tara:strand:+ start:898 stop:1200 length:303 start_codon:yes stop_codon:yes gene_type:complete
MKAKNLLNEYNCEYINVILDTSEKKLEFKESTGLKTVPQIYTDNGFHIGGYEELVTHMHRKLDEDVMIMEETRNIHRDFDSKKKLLDMKKRKLALKDKIT